MSLLALAWKLATEPPRPPGRLERAAKKAWSFYEHARDVRDFASEVFPEPEEGEPDGLAP